jgi:hypothetical protein
VRAIIIAVGEQKPYDEITAEGELEIQCPDCTAKLRLPIHAGEAATDTPVVLRKD